MQFTFFWFILSCFLQFIIFIFSKNKKLSRQLYIRVLVSDDGYQTIIYNQDINITEPYTKKTCFSNTIYLSTITIYIFSCYYLQFFLCAFFRSHFPIRICHPHPSSAGIRSAFYRHPLKTEVVWFTLQFNQFRSNMSWGLENQLVQIRPCLMRAKLKMFNKTFQSRPANHGITRTTYLCSLFIS